MRKWQMDVGLIKTRSQRYSYELFTSEAHVLVYIKSVLLISDTRWQYSRGFFSVTCSYHDELSVQNKKGHLLLLSVCTVMNQTQL